MIQEMLKPNNGLDSSTPFEGKIKATLLATVTNATKTSYKVALSDSIANYDYIYIVISDTTLTLDDENNLIQLRNILNQSSVIIDIDHARNLSATTVATWPAETSTYTIKFTYVDDSNFTGIKNTSNSKTINVYGFKIC